MAQTFETLGKYILLEKIQTGGMAEIFLALKPGASGVSKFVAIKRILPQYVEQADFIEMFKDEAKIAVNLSHANIVSIHEFGMDKGMFFIAMDFVEGRNIRQILNKMKKSGVSFSIEQVLFIAKEVAAGLDHAHRCIDANTGKPLNIIHRDMSPQNIMISFEGEVKIVDFGIAKAETQIDSTRAGTLKGKFSYMSPEQAEGQPIDLRTDIFALGIVLWELLANDRLFVANNELNTLRKVRDCQIPSLRKINPNIPPELERIVNKALAKDRNLRYQTAAAFHRELSRFLNRHYPDFSQHDFSVFIKTLFAAEILENRKKMIEYAKINLDSVLGTDSQREEPSLTVSDVTRTEHTFAPRFESSLSDQAERAAAPAATAAANPAPLPKPQPVRRTERNGANSINTSSLSVDDSVYREPGSSVRDLTGASIGSKYFESHASFSKGLEERRFSSSFLPLTLIALGAIIGMSVLFPDAFKQVQTQVVKIVGTSKGGTSEIQGESTSASLDRSNTYMLKIESVPSGAEIHVNGQPASDVTPTTLYLPKGIDAKLTIRKPGYVPFEHTETMSTNKYLNVTLQKELFGRLDINVVGSGRIYVNGKLVAYGSPANGVQVPANKEIVVRAEDPVTKAVDEVRVTVGENMTKKITLFPRRLN